MNHPQRIRRVSSWWMPQAEFDYRAKVGDGSNSSIVMACVNWIARTFPEAPLRVAQTDSTGFRTFVVKHAMERLLRRPNEFYTGFELWMASLADLWLSGNFYWKKIRGKTGLVIGLWWIPSVLIEPKWNKDDPTSYISHYAYTYDPSKDPEKIDPKDIVHVRWGLDSENIRKGCSPFRSVIREVFTDDEASQFTAALLKNMAVPGVIISPTDMDAEPTSGDLKEIKEEYEEEFGNSNRGRVMVMRTKTDVQVLSWSPQQLDLKMLRRIPEERVTAVVGIPAVVAGLGAGLDRSTFANFKEAREAAFESTSAPLYQLVATQLTFSLLPDFEPKAKIENGDVEAAFDISKIRVLQEDENKLAERVGRLFERGVYTRKRALIEMGETPGPADDVYRMPKSHIEVPASEGAVKLTDQILSSGGGGFGSEDPNAKKSYGDEDGN